ERVLSWLVATAVFVLANLFIWSWLFNALTRARAELVTRKAALAEQGMYIRERDLWIKRAQWIRDHQPALKNPAEASTLLEQLKQLGEKYNIRIQNPLIGGGGTSPYHQTVVTTLQTK